MTHSFRPRARLPIDPFINALHSPWRVQSPSQITNLSPPQVILLLGDPSAADLLPILTSPRLSSSLLILVSSSASSQVLHALQHSPTYHAQVTPYTPGPSVYILQISSPLDVHEQGGALRLISLLNRAGRVADEWRKQRRRRTTQTTSTKRNGQKHPYVPSPFQAEERTILHLFPDCPEGDFCVVKSLAFWPPKPSSENEQQTPSPAPSLAPSPEAKSRRFSISLPLKASTHEPTSTKTASTLPLSKPSNNYPQYYYLNPTRSARRLPSVLDATSHDYSRYPSPSNNNRSSTPAAIANSTSANVSGTRTFDAILNFLPASSSTTNAPLPDKSLLKYAILVTTLSAQYLAGEASSAFADGNHEIARYHAHRLALGCLSQPVSDPLTNQVRQRPNSICVPPPAMLSTKWKETKSTKRAGEDEADSKQRRRRFSAFVASPFGSSSSTSSSLHGMDVDPALGELGVVRARPRPSSVVGSNVNEKMRKRFSLFLPGARAGEPEVQPTPVSDLTVKSVGSSSSEGTSGKGWSVVDPVPLSPPAAEANTPPFSIKNAHVVHILPSAWFDASSSIGSSGSCVPFPTTRGSKLNPNHSVASSSGLPATFKQSAQKPKLVQGIEQFLLGFAAPGSSATPSSMLRASQSSSSSRPSRPAPTPVPSVPVQTSTSTSSSSSPSSGRPSFSSFSSFSSVLSPSTSAPSTPGTTPPASRPVSTYGTLPAPMDGQGKGKGKAPAANRHSYHASYAAGGYEGPGQIARLLSDSSDSEKEMSGHRTRWSVDGGSTATTSPVPGSVEELLRYGASGRKQAASTVPYLVAPGEFARRLGCAVCGWVEGERDREAEDDVDGVNGEGEGEKRPGAQRRETSCSEEEEYVFVDHLASASASASAGEGLSKLCAPLTTGEAVLLGLLDFDSSSSSCSSSSPVMEDGAVYDEYTQAAALLDRERAWIGRGDVVLKSQSKRRGGDAELCCKHAVWRERRERERREREGVVVVPLVDSPKEDVDAGKLEDKKKDEEKEPVQLPTPPESQSGCSSPGSGSEETEESLLMENLRAAAAADAAALELERALEELVPVSLSSSGSGSGSGSSRIGVGSSSSRMGSRPVSVIQGTPILEEDREVDAAAAEEKPTLQLVDLDLDVVAKEEEESEKFGLGLSLSDVEVDLSLPVMSQSPCLAAAATTTDAAATENAIPTPTTMTTKTRGGGLRPSESIKRKLKMFKFGSGTPYSLSRANSMSSASAPTTPRSDIAEMGSGSYLGHGTTEASSAASSRRPSLGARLSSSGSGMVTLTMKERWGALMRRNSSSVSSSSPAGGGGGVVQPAHEEVVVVA